MEKRTKEQFLKQEAESFPESKYGSKIKKAFYQTIVVSWVVLRVKYSKVFMRQDESDDHESLSLNLRPDREQGRTFLKYL